MLSMIILTAIGIFFICGGLLSKTPNFYSALVFRALPFLSGFYILISLYSEKLNSPIALGSIGLLFVCLSVLIRAKNFLSQMLYIFIPLVAGIFLIIFSLKSLNLI